MTRLNMLLSAQTASLHGRLKVVGRDSHLEELLAKAQNLGQSGGNLVLVTGERGIGKTTLIRELRSRLSQLDSDLPFVTTGCPAEVGKEVSFLPFRLMSDFARTGKSIDHSFALELASAALGCVPVVGPFLLLGSLPIKRAVESMYRKDEKDRELLFRQSADRLIEAGSKKPVVFVIDDVQWIDLSSLFLINLIAKELAHSKLLLVLVLSEREAHQLGILHAISENLSDLDESLYCRMELRNLDLHQVELLLEAQFPSNKFDKHFAEWLLRHTGGSPYLIVETLQHLILKRFLCQQDDGWYLKHEAPVDVPRRIEDFVRLKIDSLDRDSLYVVEAASVIGQEFDSSVLADLLRLEKRDLARVLQALCRQHHVLEPRPAVLLPTGLRFRYSFVDEHTKRVLYEGIHEETRCILHRRIAEILQAGAPQARLDAAEQLSFHLEQGADYEQALKCAVESALSARTSCAFDEAMRFLDRSLRCLSRMKELSNGEAAQRDSFNESSIVLTFHKGVIYRLLGKLSDAISTLAPCIEQFANVKKDTISCGGFGEVTIADVYEHLGLASCGAGAWEDAKKYFDACIHQVKRMYLARRYNHIAWQYALAGQYLDEASQMIDRTIELRGLPYDYGVRGWIRFQQGAYEGAAEDVKKAIAGIQQTKSEDVGAINVDNFHLGFIYFESGRLPEAREQLTLALKEYRENFATLRYDKNAPSQEKVARAVNLLKQINDEETEQKKRATA